MPDDTELNGDNLMGLNTPRLGALVVRPTAPVMRADWVMCAAPSDVGCSDWCLLDRSRHHALEHGDCWTGLGPERQGHTMALTVLRVPSLLDSGYD
jgi:hypothetical protein